MKVIPLTCERCRKNFCLRHRHEMDHNCQGFENTGRGVTSQGLVIITTSESCELAADIRTVHVEH